MKIAAYQFTVTNDIKKNWEAMKNAILQAANQKIRLLVFPECAFTNGANCIVIRRMLGYNE